MKYFGLSMSANPLWLFWKSFYRQDFLRAFWDEREIRYVWAQPDIDMRPQLRKELKRFYRCNDVILTQSGRAAIRIAMRMLHLQEQKIAVPSFCCESVLLAVAKEKCTPVLIDVTGEFQIELDSLQEAIDKHSISAVIVPHYGAIASNISEVIKLCRRARVKVIEDAAQSVGLQIDGKYTGTIGDVGILSFGQGKMLTSFSGGAVIVNDEQDRPLVLPSQEPSFFAKVVFYCRHVRRRVFLPFFLVKDKLKKDRGTSLYATRAMSRTDAAIVLAQLQKLGTVLRKRAANAAVYYKHLPTTLARPPQQKNCFLKYMVRFSGPDTSKDMELFLRAHRIETEGTFTPKHLEEPWVRAPRTSLRMTEEMWRGLLTLPCHPGLDPADIRRICEVAKRARAACPRPLVST